MKLCLFLCAAAALAAKDTTPPVVSLTFTDLATKWDDCATHACDAKVHASASPSASDTANTELPSGVNVTGTFHSVTCEVQEGATNCPLPSCTAYDHHDFFCKQCVDAGSKQCSACGNKQNVDLNKWCTGREGTAPNNAWAATETNQQPNNCTHQFPCVPKYVLINVDGNSPSSPRTEETNNSVAWPDVDRNLRSEWVIEYTASDRSNNPADKVSFTMIFQDTQAPSLETEFCATPLPSGTQAHRDSGDTDTVSVTAAATGTDADHQAKNCAGTAITRKFAQSCTECQNTLTDADRVSFSVSESTKTTTAARGEDTCALADTEACTHSLSGILASVDKYDGNILTAGYDTAKLFKPDGTEIDCTSGCNIDTSVLGAWSVEYYSRDNAGIYGTNEENNWVRQNATIQVVDTRPPTIYMEPAKSAAEYGNDYVHFCDNDAAGGRTDLHPIVECLKTGHADAFSYAEPTVAAYCEDLRDSWVSGGSSNKFDHATVTADSYTIDMTALDKTSTTNTKYQCAYTINGNTRTDHYVNTYTINYNCADSAGVNGASGANNNAAQKTRTVRIEDTAPPTVTLKDGSGQDITNGDIVTSSGFNSHSSNHGFEGASGSSNSHNSVNCTGHQGTCNGADHTTGFTDWTKLGVGRTAITRTSAGSDPDSDINGHLGGAVTAAWKGARCDDSCNPNPTMVATLHHGQGCTGALVTGDSQDGDLKNFPEFAPGDYSIKYVCTDGDNSDFRPAKVNSACRNINNVDATKPIIQILGNNDMVLEATHTGNYVDDGAVCYDQVDGVISQNVEVSGDVVNLAKVGNYIVTYNCKDSAGNVAPTESRHVEVRQTGCPTCTVTDCPTATALPGVANNCTFEHEASFTYTDAGASCSDEIDGTVTYTTNNTVDVETTGTYIITYRAKNSVGLWNDDSTCSGGAQNYYRSVIVVDTLKPVIEVRYNSTLVARGEANDLAVHNSAANPVKDATPALMAESAGASTAWLAGAGAAAIAGVALLGFSRRTEARISVPV